MILGYGEDALTYWALSKRLAEILAQLSDSTPPDEALILFRPSFGRRATRIVRPAEAWSTQITHGPRRAEFGEFDAIVGTRAGVYLIEAKWYRSSELDGSVLTLRPEQMTRHAVFRTYLELWREHSPIDWESFERDARPRFEQKHQTVRFAPVVSTLARNLEFILRRLTPSGSRVTDVALIAARPGFAVALGESTESFKVVSLECTDFVADGFVIMDTQPSLSVAPDADRSGPERSQTSTGSAC